MAGDASEFFAWARTLEDQGDLDNAVRALQSCIDGGDSRWVERAELEMARLEIRRGNLDTAKRAYQSIIETGHDGEMVVSAIFNLATLHQQMGRFADAVQGYREVAAADQPELAAKAGNNLAYVLYHEFGDVAGAKAALEVVIDSGEVAQAALARNNLEAMRAAEPGAPSVVDPFVDVSTGIDASTGERAPFQYRIVSGSDRGVHAGRGLAPVIVDATDLPPGTKPIFGAFAGLAVAIADYSLSNVDFLSPSRITELGGERSVVREAFKNLWAMPLPDVEVVPAVRGIFQSDVWAFKTADPCAPSRYFTMEALLPLMGRSAPPSLGFLVAAPTWHLLVLYPLDSTDTRSNAFAVAAYMASMAAMHFDAEPASSRVSRQVYYLSADHKAQTIARLEGGDTLIATGELVGERLLGPDGLHDDS